MSDDLKLVFELSADNRRLVSGFGDSKQRLQQLERAAKDATAKVAQAARDLAKDPGSTALQQNLARLKTEAAATKREFQATRVSTELLRRQMGAAGLDTRNLAASLRDASVAQKALNNARQEASRVADARQTLGIRPFKDIQAEIDHVRSSFQVLRDSGVLTQGELGQAADRARQRVRALSEQFNGARTAGQRLNAVMTGLRVLFAGIAALTTGNRLLRLADDMALLLARLELVEGSAGAARRTLAALGGIAQRTGIDILAVGESYTRFARSVRSLGGDSAQALAFTEALALALKVSGASAEESAGVMRQLSQAMQKGRLNGDEFVTVAESGGQVLDYLATALGVSRGKLLEMSTAGTLTADKLLKLSTQLQQIRKDAAQLPQTVGASATRVANAFALWVAQSELLAVVSKAVSAALEFVARNMDLIIKAGAVVAVVALRLGILRLLPTLARLKSLLGLFVGATPWGRAFTLLAAAAIFASDAIAVLNRNANPTGAVAEQLATRLNQAAQAARAVGSAAQQAATDVAKLYTDQAKKAEDASQRARSAQDALQEVTKSQLEAQLSNVDVYYAARLRLVQNGVRDESAAAAQSAVLVRDAELTKLQAVDDWAARSLAALRAYYASQLALAKAAGQNSAQVQREALSAELDVLQQRQAAYRRGIDTMVAEEQRLLDAARRAAEERKAFGLDLADRIRALQQRGLTDAKAYEDRNLQVAEKTAAARKALARGDTEGAKKLAEEAMRIAESNAREVTERVQQDGKEVSRVVVTEAQAAQAAIAQIADAGRLVDAALKRQEANFKSAAAAAGQGAQAAQGQLAELQRQIAQLQSQATIKIKADIQVDVARLDALAKQLNGLLEAKTLSVQLAVDSANLEAQLKVAADKVKAGGAVPFEVTANLAKVTEGIRQLQELAQRENITLPAALNDSDARRQLDALQGALRTPTQAVHTIVSNLDAIRAQIDGLKTNTSSTHTVYVQKVEKFASGGVVGSIAGRVRGMSSGGPLPGYGGGDRRWTLLEDGEFVMRKEATRAIGAGVLASINREMRLPAVPGLALARGAAGSAAPGTGGAELNLRLLGPQGEEARVRSGRDEAQRLVRLLRNAGVRFA